MHGRAGGGQDKVGGKAAKGHQRHMVAAGIGLGEQQFDGAFRLGQADEGGRAGSIDGEDQQAVGGFEVAFQADVVGADFQTEGRVGRGGLAAQGLPRGGGAQGGDQVDAFARAGFAGKRWQRAAPVVALARCPRAA